MVGSEVDVGRPDSYVVWEDLDYVSRRRPEGATRVFLGSEVAIDRSGLRCLLRSFAVSTSSACFPWVRGRHRSLRATASPPPFRSVDIERRAAVILPLLGDTSAGGGWSGRCSHIPSRKILRHTGSGLWGCVERFAARPSAACPWNLWALSKSRIPPYPGTVCQKGVSGGGHTEVHFERRCH